MFYRQTIRNIVFTTADHLKPPHQQSHIIDISYFVSKNNNHFPSANIQNICELKFANVIQKQDDKDNN